MPRLRHSVRQVPRFGWREVLVIAGFHLIGLALELFKVHTGSWLYPGDAWTKVAGWSA